MFDNNDTAQSDLRDLLNWNPSTIAKNDVGNFNKVVRCAPHGTVAIGSQQFSYSWIDAVPFPQSLSEKIQITTNGRSITIQTSRDFIHAIYKDQIAFSGGSAILYQLAVRHALDSVVSNLEQKFGEVVCLIDSLHVDSDELTPYCFSFSSEKFENSYYITASGDHEFLNDFLKIETVSGIENTNSKINIDLSVVGSASINKSKDLDLLSEGDILICQSGTDPSSIFRLTVGEIDFGAVQMADGRLKLYRNEIHGKSSKEIANMGNPLMPHDLSSSKSEEMMVTVSIEVGETRLPLNKIVNLTSGVIVDLDIISLDSVKLKINGDLVATGALIEVGGGIGIKLKKVF